MDHLPLVSRCNERQPSRRKLIKNKTNLIKLIKTNL